MTPFENKDLRGIIFTYLRSPCEYKKPSHYEVMKPYCLMVQHEDNYYLNPLLCLLKDDMLIRGYYDTDDWETLGDVTQHFGYLEDDQVYQVDEMRENLEYYHEQKLSDVVTYV
jgi:hypothetical protein